VLKEPLGVGGFGEVWLAHHPQFTALAGAVKFCHDLQARDRDLLHESRVIDRVMAQGKRPHIVPLLDAHLEGDTPWLMFEYVPGGDLGDVINEWQMFPKSERVAKATAALHELAIAVGHFHRLTPDPVVHRDLKPANILRDRVSGNLRVTDFGIGGVMARAVLEVETRAGPTRGGRLLSCLRGSYTPLYASPQQQALGDPDPRDDVHALGVIGYQMMTGQVNRGAGPDFADDLRDVGVREEVISLLGSCVASKAEKRPADALALAERLSPLIKPGLVVDLVGHTPVTPESLRELLDKAPRFFICNTNRRGGPRIEGEMRHRRYAAVWEDFNHPAHMKRVCPGDAIFMWGKGAGVIGIGRAKATCEILEATAADRLRSAAEDNQREWRIPVEWLIWVDNDRDAYPCSMPNASFIDASGANYRDMRDGVRKHFLKGS
jgi:serine/threonine protein kinase